MGMPLRVSEWGGRIAACGCAVLLAACAMGTALPIDADPAATLRNLRLDEFTAYCKDDSSGMVLDRNADDWTFKPASTNGRMLNGWGACTGSVRIIAVKALREEGALMPIISPQGGILGYVIGVTERSLFVERSGTQLISHAALDERNRTFSVHEQLSRGCDM